MYEHDSDANSQHSGVVIPDGDWTWQPPPQGTTIPWVPYEDPSTTGDPYGNQVISIPTVWIQNSYAYLCDANGISVQGEIIRLFKNDYIRNGGDYEIMFSTPEWVSIRHSMELTLSIEGDTFECTLLRMEKAEGEYKYHLSATLLD